MATTRPCSQHTSFNSSTNFSFKDLTASDSISFTSSITSQLDSTTSQVKNHFILGYNKLRLFSVPSEKNNATKVVFFHDMFFFSFSARRRKIQISQCCYSSYLQFIQCPSTHSFGYIACLQWVFPPSNKTSAGQ